MNEDGSIVYTNNSNDPSAYEIEVDEDDEI